MKIIPKFQQGSSIWAVYTPAQMPSRQERSSGQTRSKKSDDDDDKKKRISKKDIAEILKSVDGLPNEANKLASDIIETLQLVDDSEGNITNIAIAYAQHLAELQKVKFNKEQFDYAQEIAKGNESLNDIVITDSGRMMAITQDNHIKYFTPEEWQEVKNSGDYMPITNANLLQMRYTRPEFVYRNDIFNTVQNGIGMHKVAQMIKENLQTLNSTDTHKELMVTKQGQSIIAGGQLLQSMEELGPDGVYKIKETTKDQRIQIQAALNYIYQALPKNAQYRLQFASNNSNVAQGVENILMSLIMMGSKTGVQGISQSYDLTFDSSATKSAGIGEETDSEKQKFDKWYRINKGEGGIDRAITIMEGETPYGQSVIGKYHSALPGVEKGPMSLQQFLQEAGGQDVAQAIDGISFGGMQLSKSDLSSIMYDGSGGYVAMLPATEQNGVKVVNLQVIKTYSDIVKKLENRGIKEGDYHYESELGKELEQAGLGYLLNSSGLPNPSKFGRFLIIQGYSTSNNDKIEEFYDKTQDNKSGLLQSIIKIKSSDDKKLTEQMKSVLGDNVFDKPWSPFDEDIYKSAIFIPMSDNPNDYITADNTKVTRKLSHENEAAYQDNNRQIAQQYAKQQSKQSTSAAELFK